MGCRQLSMIVLFLWVFQFPDKTVVSSAVEEKGTVFVYGRAAVGTVDEDFICATLDWWPPQKCDYGTCAWDHASILNLVFFFLSFTFLPFCFRRKQCNLCIFKRKKEKEKHFTCIISRCSRLFVENLYFLLKIFYQEIKQQKFIFILFQQRFTLLYVELVQLF